MSKSSKKVSLCNFFVPFFIHDVCHSTKVASNSGPPKSVLQRIKDSLGAEVVDNEPDPIDFLS